MLGFIFLDILDTAAMTSSVKQMPGGLQHMQVVSSRPGNWRARAPIPLGKRRILVFDVGSVWRQVKLKTPKFLVPKAVKDFEVKFKQFIAWEF